MSMATRVLQVIQAGTLEGADDDVIREMARRYLRIRLDKHRRMAERETEQSVIKMRREAEHNAVATRLLQTVFDRARDMADLPREILSSTFSLGGVEVSMGEATYEQHKLRFDGMLRTVTGTVETLAIHQKAMDMIERTGARTLAEAIGGDEL